MKTRILHIVVAFVLAMMALPTLAQDCMEVYFKDGTTRKFYLKNVTEITTSRQDADGVMHSDYDYQHVTTLYDKYIYALSDVDSIAFTKYNEEKVRENFILATNTIFPSIYDCETVEDAEKVINTLENSKDIEKAWLEDETLYVKIPNWGVMSFDFGIEEKAPVEESSFSREIEEIVKVVSQETEASGGNKLKAVVANQTAFDDESARKSAKKDLDKLTTLLNNNNIETTPISRPGIEFFASDLFNYDIVIICTHGGYKDGKHSILSGEELGKVKHKSFQMNPSKETQNEWLQSFLKVFEKLQISKSDLTDQDINFHWVKEDRGNETYWVGYPQIFETFYDKIDKVHFRNPKSIMFWATCRTLKKDKGLAQKFFDRDLGVFAGYNEYVSFYTAPPAALKFFELLLKGVSLETAYSEMPLRYKTDLLSPYNSYLYVVPNSKQHIDYYNSIFVTKTVTNEIDEEKAKAQFNNSNYVEVEGLTTTTDKKAITYGFVYAEKGKLSTHDPITDVEVMELSSTIDKGNVLFRGKITGLEADKEYNYQAFTYDGKFYNYGNMCSFSLKTPTTYPDLQVAPQKLTLEVGEKVTFDITAGSGVYEAISENENVATASVNGKEVTIVGVSAKTTTVIIKDSETEQEASIQIVVTEPTVPEIPAEAIDLGLPSGTLWAAFNVGATKPEEYGLYFAWGETQGYRGNEPHFFGWSNYKWCNGGYNKLTKYCSKAEYGVVDNKTTLDLADDAARANWGAPWVMPTDEQIRELQKNCKTEWTEKNGVSGMLYTSKLNGKSVFFPAAGIRWENEIDWVGSGSWFFWSSTVSVIEPYKAGDLSRDNYIYYGASYIYTSSRYFGRSVRPVISSNQTPIEYPDLKVAPQKLTLEVGEKVTFDITAGSGKYDAISKNDDVATASVNGKEVTIVGVSVETTTVVIKDTETNQEAPIQIEVIKPSVPTTPAEAIDLGLPSGTKWASYNLGAAKIEDYGCYFAWGETEEKDRYKWSTYTLCDDGNERKCHNIGSDIAGTQYDVARQMWGGSWQMPDYDHWLELKDNTSYSMTTINGVSCCKLTGPNGKSIYLPASGQFDDYRVVYDGSVGNYWSSSKYGESTAYMAFFTNESGGFLTWGNSNRCIGYTIRPVIPGDKPVFPDLKLSANSLTLDEGTSGTVQVTSGSGKYRCAYESYGTITAAVDGSTITVTALTAGDVKLIVSDTQSGQQKEIAVTVKAKPQITYPNLTLASTATLNLKTRQNSGYDITSGSGSYSVKSSNNNVATAEITDFVNVITSENGKSVRVTAVGVGNATITVTDNLSGQTASFNVSVTQNVDLLKLSTYSLSLKEGESGEVLITSSGNGNVLIATSDASVASFTSSGNKITVKGLKAGTCTVSVNDGQTGETAEVAVTVTARQFVLSNYGPINVTSGTSYIISILNGGREGVMVNQTNYDNCSVGLDDGIVAIIGKNKGKSYVTITDQKSNEEVVVEVNITDPAVAPGTPAEAVDLGLPSGTKWATFNVGAVKPADFGGFYAWGETVEKTDYSVDDYTMWSKYSYSGSRVRLSSSDDVANKLWGGSWHMPTYEQMTELVNYCSWFWTTINGVNGHLVLGLNYHVIFLPAAGTKADGSHNVANRRLTYWTSDSNGSSTAFCMYSWDDDTRDVDPVSRVFGYSVRPVK